jgi:YggT family protein
MQSALIFLVKTLADLYLLTFLLRFIMQWVRASYYNPLAQFVLKVTSPLVVPARRVLPSLGGLDTPTLAVLILLEIVVTFVLLRLAGISLPVPVLLLYSFLRLIALALWFYTVALFIYVLLSWFGDRGMNPMAALLGELIEPLLRPARRLLPPIGGLDLSALVVILLLQAALIALPLPGYLR